MTGYTRQSVASITNGEDVTAPPLNAEFNQLQSAFDGVTGHSHDGLTGSSPKINLDTSVSGYLPSSHGGTGGLNNMAASTAPLATHDASSGYAPGSIWLNASTGRFYLCVINTVNNAIWTELVAVQEADRVVPHTDDAISIGTNSYSFKDGYFTGTVIASNFSATQALTSTGGLVISGASNLDTVQGTTISASTGFVGDLSGNVIGDLTGTVLGDVTGDLTGNVTAGSGTSTFSDVAITGGIDFSGSSSTITNLPDPVDLDDAVNKRYVHIILGSAETAQYWAQDAENSAIEAANSAASLGNMNLDAIDATISDTAVDVFVYDTSKDSDGGAWRKRTQHTSWYNETLDTATRGSRKEFPAVAVIVAESNQVTIYDGDDPDLPMWMVFNITGGGAVFGDNTNVIQSVVCLNGWMSVGLTRPSTTGNLSVADFIGDRSGFVYNNASDIRSTGNITDRNSTYQYPSGTSNFFTDDPIVNRNVNDVAMTVLPNAPIDAATGLPVPTIAVATNGGVSVIKDDGTVVDSSTTNSITTVSFLDNNYLVCSGGTTIQTFHVYESNGFSSYKTYTATGSIPAIGNINDHISAVSLNGTRFAKFSNHPEHCLAIVEEDVTVSTNGSVAYINPEYNTGHMVGDIKLATLCDTDTTPISAVQYITGDSSTFTNGIGIWTGDITATGGVGVVDISATNTEAKYVFPAGVLTEGVTYSLSFDLSITSGTPSMMSLLGVNTIYLSSIAAGSHSFTFTASADTANGTNSSAALMFFGTGAVYSIDNVQVSSGTLPDRSANQNSLTVKGELDRTPVATGADLVAYSGFSSSNYLEQPYNSDLDITGSLSICYWIKGGSSSQSLMGLGSGTRYSEQSWHIYHDGGSDYRLTLHSNGTTEQQYEIADAVGSANWQYVCWTLSGGIVKGYLNGVEKSSAAFSGTLTTQSSTQNTLKVGTSSVSSAGHSGSLALLRISATAPTAEQIAKIYEDEKVLFQENAKATLYGTYHDVKSLAYDDDTNLLHVGTQSGRSVFQGLARVTNTTTPVSAAISASNGLVVED